MNADSVRVVEVTAAGQVIDEAVPFQFDPVAGFNNKSNAGGTLIFMLTGETAASATRYYHVYFGVGNNASLAQVTAARPPKVKLTETTDEGFASYRITSPTATYYYHIRGGGFSSLEDKDGIDWIDWNDSNGAAGNFRGIPNMVHPSSGGYFHPGRTTSSSQIVSQGAWIGGGHLLQ